MEIGTDNMRNLTPLFSKKLHMRVPKNYMELETEAYCQNDNHLVDQMWKANDDKISGK